MSLGFYFAPAAMSADTYDECIKRLAKAGAAHPKGRLYHASFGPPDKLMVFDVWDSQASFDQFGQTLIPILSDLGVDPGQPSVMPIHSVIVPPAPRAKASKPSKKKRAASKPARKPAKKAKKARRR